MRESYCFLKPYSHFRLLSLLFLYSPTKTHNVVFPIALRARNNNAIYVVLLLTEVSKRRATPASADSGTHGRRRTATAIPVSWGRSFGPIMSPSRARRQGAGLQRPPPPAVGTADPAVPALSPPRTPLPARSDLVPQPAAFQTALPDSRSAAYLQQRDIPLALQYGVVYATPGTWPHAVRDWRGGRVVLPHTTPAGRLVNLYGRAVDTSGEVPKAHRHDHLPGEKGYFKAAAPQADDGPLWVCEGAFDALALRAAGVPRIIALFGVQGWRWDWVRHVRDLVFALDADAAGQQQWRTLTRQAVSDSPGFSGKSLTY